MPSRTLRRLVALGAFLVLGSVAISAAVLDAAAPRQGLMVNLGPVEQFEPGSVTTFLVRDGRVERITELPRSRVGELGIHIVRLPDGGVSAFSWRGPESGWAIWWMPDLVTFEPNGYFIDTGDGTRWYYDGGRAFGPAQRNLDRYHARIDDRGRVIVDISTTIPGGDPPPPPLRAERT